MAVKERIKSALESRGFEAGDIPKAIGIGLVFHEITGLGVMVLFWGACYKVRPTRFLFNKSVKVLPRNIAHRLTKNERIWRLEGRERYVKYEIRFVRRFPSVPKWLPQSVKKLDGPTL